MLRLLLASQSSGIISLTLSDSFRHFLTEISQSFQRLTQLRQLSQAQFSFRQRDRELRLLIESHKVQEISVLPDSKVRRDTVITGTEHEKVLTMPLRLHRDIRMAKIQENLSRRYHEGTSVRMQSLQCSFHLFLHVAASRA